MSTSLQRHDVPNAAPVTQCSAFLGRRRGQNNGLSSDFEQGEEQYYPDTYGRPIQRNPTNQKNRHDYWPTTWQGLNGNKEKASRTQASQTNQREMMYIIERVGDGSFTEKDFEEIAEMCINVFFKEQGNNADPDDRIAPWKEAQLSYLKALQTADLVRRRSRFPETNEMFIAYEVKKVAKDSSQSWTDIKQPLILDLNKIHNLPQLSRLQSNVFAQQQDEYVRGLPIGFVEVTQRSYGLGNGSNQDGQQTGDDCARPILTNLAVAKLARQSGVGSKLLEDCERHVAREWNMKEIILEVEDFNEKALDFYTKRGYKSIFRDPASRRYDVTGLVLRKVRCTREIMRKSLSLEVAQKASDGITNPSFDMFENFCRSVSRAGQ